LKKRYESRNRGGELRERIFSPRSGTGIDTNGGIWIGLSLPVSDMKRSETNYPMKKDDATIAENNNITWFNGHVSRKKREKIHGHRGAVIWFTGLSASGKSTIAHHLEKQLHRMGCSTYVFDGDNVRHGLCNDLGFSEGDRSENVRRIGEMTKLFLDAGIIAITAFISPSREDRQTIRGLFTGSDFLEVFVDCPLEVCESRDEKGIYARARQGEIKHFTGISAPYEPPANPDLVIQSDVEDVESAAARVLELMRQEGILPKS